MNDPKAAAAYHPHSRPPGEPVSAREWRASVGYRNAAGQTETAAGTGTTPDEALADARQQPRMLVTPTEIGYVLSSREVGEWQPEAPVYHQKENTK